MKYTVIIEPRARRDLEAAVEWMSAGSEATAIQWYIQVVDAIVTLEEFPARCPVAPESGQMSYEIRQLLHGKRRSTYRILFTIKGDCVHVLHIRHGLRDWVEFDDFEHL